MIRILSISLQKISVLFRSKRWPLLAAGLLMLFPLLGTAQTPGGPGSIEIEEGGQIWIEGSASIVDYTCSANEPSGNGSIENVKQPQENVKGDGSVSVVVSIPVEALSCGKKAMDKDLYNALKVKEHPQIQYALLEANLSESQPSITDDEGEWMNIITHGILTIAGVSDTTRVNVKGRLLSDNRFRVKGSKQVHMDTFHIDPPTAMLGLIKADKELEVFFDVTVRLLPETGEGARRTAFESSGS